MSTDKTRSRGRNIDSELVSVRLPSYLVRILDEIAASHDLPSIKTRSDAVRSACAQFVSLFEEGALKLPEAEVAMYRIEDAYHWKIRAEQVANKFLESYKTANSTEKENLVSDLRLVVESIPSSARFPLIHALKEAVE